MLEISGVNKSFGRVKALDDVSFSVPRGVLTGFVGGNGAGKTTTMRIIMGVLEADGGSVSLDGAPLTRAVSSRFGYMPEERGLYPKMNAAEQCAYLARLHGLDKAEAEGRAITLLESLGLGRRAYDPVETLSLGNQQRAQIALALVHDPDVLVLDEPFSGLDPIAVDTVHGILDAQARRGAAVLFSSHQLDVVERITQDVVIIGGGQIRAAGRRDALLAAHARPRHRLATGTDLGWVATWPGVGVVEPVPALPGEPPAVEFEADAAAAQGVLRHALELGEVAEFAPVVPTLAEVFKEVMADAPEPGSEAGGDAAGNQTEAVAA
jgi:ABC-2 type transport system ATP-binding protein